MKSQSLAPGALKHVSKEYRGIIDRIDPVFAVTTVTLLLFQVEQWRSGTGSLNSVWIMVSYVITNFIISVSSKNFPKNQIWMESLRFSVANPILASCIYLLVDGALSPNWFAFVINAVGINPVLFALPRRTIRVSIQSLNILNFWICSAFHHDPSVTFASTMKITGILILCAITSELVLDVLRKSMLKTAEQTEALTQSKNELHQKERFLQAFLDHIPGMVYAKDTDGKYILVNQAQEAIAPHSLLGRKDDDYLNDPMFASRKQADEKILKEGRSAHIEEQFAGPQGPTTWATTKFCLFEDEKAVAVCGISMDITEHEKSQQALEDAKAKMLSSSKMSALGEMATGMAHEINNPLAIIQAKSFVLKQAASKGVVTSEMVTATTEKIMDTTKRISKIIQALRTFSRDGDSADFEAATVSSIVTDSVELCESRFNAKNLPLHVAAIPADLSFECRSVQVCQVLVNLINNAYDAIENDPKGWVKIEARDVGDGVEFSVTDSGHGIPVDIRDKILQPFFTTKEIGKGTGLGLSVSTGIMRAHSGRLQLDTACPNTRFVLWFPKKYQGNSTGNVSTAA